MRILFSLIVLTCYWQVTKEKHHHSKHKKSFVDDPMLSLTPDFQQDEPGSLFNGPPGAPGSKVEKMEGTCKCEFCPNDDKTGNIIFKTR